VNYAGEFKARLAQAQASVANQELAAMLVIPGPSLRYLTGYDALLLERLTCLVVLGDDVAPVLVVPALERPAAVASGVAELGIDIMTWQETDDPYALISHLLPTAGVMAVDNHMWAETLTRLKASMPDINHTLAGTIIDELRMRKSATELDALRDAGAAIDRVHARMSTWLSVGRTEREVGRDIAAAIIEEGHVSVDFVIVASGPNGASPHHEVSDRIIEVGVVDIGGTTPLGYCSDSTRTYAMGSVDPDFARSYTALVASQEAAFQAATIGATAESIDEAARSVLTAAGLGEVFIHRTGHGIGMSTHEEPYIVSGNRTSIQPGMAFSIEPGFYVEGQWGARLEDIVIMTPQGCERVNHRPRELVIL
jgi:Xaa-Pro aminopeptidase